MIRLRAKELLEKNGKTKYWLYKQLGMSYQNFSKMINNETKSIRYENIETLCLLFSCTPNDLFEINNEKL
ncbi:MAG: helix-turn-helix transcriptional regulator [Clostridia bacterium]|nr:helix-turn-helix transcriptional regulator [Clostridia bacterium]